MSRWPEPDREPGEPPSWLGLAAFVGLAVALAVHVFGDRAWRLPTVSMPQIEMPQVAARAPEREAHPAAPPAEIPGEEFAARVDSAMSPEGGTSVRSVPFGDCLRLIDNMGSTFVEPIVIEDTSDRRMLRYKFEDGDLTLTCSRADNTMTIQTLGMVAPR
ncbi:hypothetical protein [Terricaulis sp.]|uniref:hypothetical protein n=1 Tax=Terricaulis sp. TaxID=2768686 RepID=UPI002AC63F16|nr:hypothetical protein [Terricaulis sp.]MDZ4693261.1 hypothetical protein [Terricaulis sp.]